MQNRSVSSRLITRDDSNQAPRRNATTTATRTRASSFVGVTNNAPTAK
ncbi:unnamed protein product, partial [Linum tenue]